MIETLRILIDFGLVVLIWVVQLAIYPGFRYYARMQLIAWHRKYAIGITTVVFPLMIAQLALVALQIYHVVDAYTITSLVVVIFQWGATFGWFVPMHNRIAHGDFDDALLARLTTGNWIRTIPWTALCILTFIHYV